MGVELDSPTGKNDGSVNGIRYFKCRPNYGIFLLQSRVKRADGAAKKVSANNTPISSGAESTDYASGSISLATSSEAEASSPSPYASPGANRKKLGVSSSRLENRASCLCFVTISLLEHQLLCDSVVCALLSN